MTPIRRRLVAALWSLLVPALVATAVGGVALTLVVSGFSATTRTFQHRALPVAELRTDVLVYGANGFQYAAMPSVFTHLQFASASGDLEDALVSLVDDPATDAEDDRLLTAAGDRLREGRVTVEEVAADGDGFPAAIPRMQAFAEAIDDAVADLDRVAVRAQESVDASRAAAATTRLHATLAMAAVLALAVVVLLLLARQVRRWLVQPLDDLHAATRHYAEGRLDHRVPVLRNDELGALAHAFNDMAHRLAASRDALAHQAFHDPLTGLANRALVLDRTQHALDRIRRTRGHVALLLLDLDGFKDVNDTLGHGPGDELLRLVASRVAEIARESDTAGRLGGDEFVVLLEDLEHVDQVDAVVARLRDRLHEPAHVGGREVVVRASIGVAVGTEGDVAADLLRQADLAMYAAKQTGRDRTAHFAQQMHDEAVARTQLTDDLRHAIEQQEGLVLHYQPTVDLDTGALVGVEALVRWEHPELGLLQPNAFIPLAESSGLVLPLGWWVLHTACAQVAHWQASYPDVAMEVSVNVSALQVQADEMLAQVEAALATSGVAPHQLVLEITESTMMVDAAAVRARLLELRGLGVRVAVDDFGTGYSSLAYLQDFAVDVLKIDRSFVTAIGSAEDDGTMLRTIVAMAQALRLETVAEGIELPEQRDAMRALGCRLAQGFLFDRPLPADEVEARLADPEGLRTRWRGDAGVPA